MAEENVYPTSEHIQGINPPPQPREQHITEHAIPRAAPAPAIASATRQDKLHPEPKDNVREIIETIVFVAVLVLLLKTFVAEAFVIPTGSMAPTLLGYHKKVTCEQCGYHFLLNASSEGDPQRGMRSMPVIGGYCPNCRFYNQLYRNEPQGPLP